jgi:DNA segregation ATPase FtsK/SpoIIIE-like protein
MIISPVGEQRRCALLRISAIIAMTLWGATEARPLAAAGPIATEPHDPLLADAAAYIEEIFQQRGAVIVGPVSLLQRHFSLGYGRAIRLTAALEKLNAWSIFHDASGMRSARRIPGHGGDSAPPATTPGY